jgi:tetratricopeptide (TPR) repeat protein
MNKIKELRFFLILAVLLGFILPAKAQKTAVYSDNDAGFKQGLALFEKEQYAAAQHYFVDAGFRLTDRNTVIATDADYYSAICSMELFHKDAEFLLKKFIKDHPESPRVRSAYFYLGKYNYRKKVYKDALEWFNKVEIYDLTENEKKEYYFKRGYSYLERDSTEKAKNDFAEIKDEEGKYMVPAIYYHAHILYGEKKYETALIGFQKLEKDPVFGPVVPYYISQILYLQKKFDEVITYAPAVLDSASTKRAPELARTIGEAYFKTNHFKEAIPFLERYKKTAALNRSDAYELGYAYYMVSDYDKAISAFKEAVGKDDSLSQNVYYHLGTCYLQKQNKHFAQNAFGEASRMHFIREIREDALFSFAELTYELSYSPFSQAIKALQQYIAEYPGSPRADEAYSFLVKINLVTKNYEDALKSIESIKTLTEPLKPVYQQIAYNRGVELYNNFDYDGAIKLFAKARKYPVDLVTNALAKYWTAEASYQKALLKGDQNLFETALENYKLYMVEPGAPRTPMYNTIQYQIGYALFNMKEYPAAITSLRKYTILKNEPPDKISNAYMRVGDSYYVTKDFANAADYYAQAYDTKTTQSQDKDYALYQKGMSLGLIKKYEKKIDALTSLLNIYPKSVYGAASKFEVAHSYQQLDQPDDAITYFNRLIAENNGSPYVRRCYARLGLIYQNKEDYPNALINYKKVVSLDAHSVEAATIWGQIEYIYIKVNKDPEGYTLWLKEVGRNIPASHLDSLTYIIAKDYYDKGDCQNAVVSFAKYIYNYPSGIYILEANFNKAECDLNNKEPEAAMVGYNFILSQPVSKFTEYAIRRVAAICFNKKDFKTAFENYSKLEAFPEYASDARIGMMRSSWALKDYDNASIAANKVLTSDNPTPDIAAEAHLIIARSAMQKQNYDLAYNEYSIVLSVAKNENGAEAAYTLALIQNMRKEYKQTEKSVFELIKQQAGYKLWVGKAFILLSDNYLALNDTFQAKYVLNNFISHTELDELKAQAQDKLTKILEAEKAREKAKLEKDITVPMNNEKDKKLFEDEKKEEPQ